MRIQDATRYRRLPLRAKIVSAGEGRTGDDHLLVYYFFTTNELM
jgi:hypothetical protein